MEELGKSKETGRLIRFDEQLQEFIDSLASVPRELPYPSGCPESLSVHGDLKQIREAFVKCAVTKAELTSMLAHQSADSIKEAIVNRLLHDIVHMLDEAGYFTLRIEDESIESVVFGLRLQVVVP